MSRHSIDGVVTVIHLQGAHSQQSFAGLIECHYASHFEFVIARNDLGETAITLVQQGATLPFIFAPPQPVVWDKALPLSISVQRQVVEYEMANKCVQHIIAVMLGQRQLDIGIAEAGDKIILTISDTMESRALHSAELQWSSIRSVKIKAAIDPATP